MVRRERLELLRRLEAGLDLLGELDLLVGGQQRRTAYVAQVQGGRLGRFGLAGGLGPLPDRCERLAPLLGELLDVGPPVRVVADDLDARRAHATNQRERQAPLFLKADGRRDAGFVASLRGQPRRR